MVKQKKVAKFGANAAPVKRPVVGEPIYEGGHPLAWRFSHTDRGGPFAWNIEPAEKFHEVIHKLVQFETKNWNEITAGGSHYIATNKLTDEARTRLIEIQKDDLDALLSLRLTGENRVWCVKSDHIVRPLWWDEGHGVYKTERDKGDRAKRRRRGDRG